MLTYPNIDPVALSLGPVKVHWYGLMYLLAFRKLVTIAQRPESVTPIHAPPDCKSCPAIIELLSHRCKTALGR